MKSFSKLIMKAVCASFALSTQITAGCCDPCCPPPVCCDPCGCQDKFWFDADYLYWQFKNDRKCNNALVVTGPAVADGTAILGDPAYTPVLRDKRNDNWRSGGRFSLGYWFDDESTYGVELLYFFFPERSRNSHVFSDGAVGSEFLAVPLATGSVAIALPGSFSGDAHLKRHNSLQNAELNGLVRLPWFNDGCCDPCSSYKVAGLVGFRYINFDDRFKFTTDSPFIAIPSDIFRTYDKFEADNNFYGGQIGVVFDYNYDAFTVNVKGKVALGAVDTRRTIKGATISNAGGTLTPPVVTPGGILTSAATIGHHSKSEFAVVPEFDVNLGYKVTENLTLRVGYTFLYISKVQRAGHELGFDFTTETTSHHNRNRDFWAQGVNAGLEFTF